VQRKPLHGNSAAWARAMDANESEYPEEFKEWVDTYESVLAEKQSPFFIEER